jgi:hypothetical protein
MYQVRIDTSKDGEPHRSIGKGTWSGGAHESPILLPPHVENIPDEVLSAIATVLDSITKDSPSGRHTLSVGGTDYAIVVEPEIGSTKSDE